MIFGFADWRVGRFTRIAFGLLCFVIILSYSVIWFFVWYNGKYLRRIGHVDTRKMITKREIQTIHTLFLVCICFLLFVALPKLVWYELHQIHQYPVLDLILHCLFYLQFSLNFFIYAAKSEQYKKAYAYYMRRKIQFME